MEKETDSNKTAIVRDVFIIVAAAFLILDNILLIAMAIVTWQNIHPSLPSFPPLPSIE